jgi:PAS domain S-box-containing protein
MKATQRWWLSFPFLLALSSILFWGWSVQVAISSNYDGIVVVEHTGLVAEVEPESPAEGVIEEGDYIISIDGEPHDDILEIIDNKNIGEQVHLVLERDGVSYNTTLTLIKPPLREIVIRLIPLLVAIVFWMVGVGVSTFRSQDRAINLFLVFSQVGTIMLTAGATSIFGFSFTKSIFNFSLWFLGPIMVRFHLDFPTSRPHKGSRYFLWVLNFLAAIGGISYLLMERNQLAAFPWAADLRLAGQLFFAINLLIVIALLIYSYRTAVTADTRGKIRIVSLGGLVGMLPLVTLTILPKILFQKPIIPNEFAFIILCVIPLSYGYAIIRHRLIEIEKHVNRGATQVLVYSLVGGIYLVLSYLGNQILARTSLDQWITNTVVVLFLASVFAPLKKQVQIYVDRAFYGGWYDYRSAVTQITQGLEQITDLRLLARTICERTLNTLLMGNIYLFLTGPKGDLSIYETRGEEETIFHQAAAFPILPLDSALLGYLQEIGGAVDSTSLRETIGKKALSPEDQYFLDFDNIRLWVPIFGREKITGVLALGPKIGGDIFSVDDLYILGVVSRQIGPLIENIHLLTRLRKHAKDLEKRVEARTAELHDAKERVEAILASVGDGVIVTDLDGKIITVNQAFEKQSSLNGQDVFGREIFELFREHNPAKVLDDMHQTLRNGEVWIGELVNQRNDDSPKNVQMTMAPVRDQHGRMVGFVGSQRDITQQRELDRLKDQFISDVSHELRTPVTNLSLYLGLLERSNPEKRAEYLAIIRGQTKRLTGLLEDILDLSRLERKKSSKVNLVPLNINAVTEQVIAAHRLLANTSGLELMYEAGDDLPLIHADENLLARVVTNLVSNSIRYTPSGKVCVRTFLEDGKVCLQVEDTGMGIDPEDFPHIFERFYRGRRVSQSKIPGTGLGLAIVKEIIEIHEGSLEVISAVDQGAQIKVWFPVQEVVVWPERLS